MLTCDKCNQHFHLRCLAVNSSILWGDDSYTFTCANCDESGAHVEKLVRSLNSWANIARVGLYNLQLRSHLAGQNKVLFRTRKDLCEFIDVHWGSLCGNRVRTPTW